MDDTECTLTIDGKEIHNPALKWLAVILMVIALQLMLPVLIPSHFVLRASGRNGFFHAGGIRVDPSSFERRR